MDEKDKKTVSSFDIVRAATTIVVFGIPLIAGITALFGYGIKKIKNLKKSDKGH
ncbi:MAG TPA: hypothetical protein PK864_08535 [Syntrophorhabdaceae bacterium]|nr:hypothetical protein [Syntrophorhabdaceae bacterium]HOL06042.1 hypothetical protein [Syntrophorhabdaceae bacterium]HON86058.1 hypothetical protein [Syntrophorhabdaceae bacterium]HOT42063.1 hypothetical protein [Syntrophorhabdaceae bacterium]HPC66787.1 hypothetical protein [Syntrophorhabdaceae bacterium]